MILTVAVPTIPGRESLLSRCLFSIVGQAPATVDVLVIDGPGLLGDKVNLAAEYATGRWMTVVDDDDWIAADYMQRVLPELRAYDPDYVGLQVLEQTDGRFAKLTSTSAEFNRWGNAQRGPVPKGVTRTDIWRRCPMGNAWKADRDWQRAVVPMIRAWRFVPHPLYFYDFWGASSAFHDGQTRDVGEWPFDESRITRLHLPPG